METHRHTAWWVVIACLVIVTATAAGVVAYVNHVQAAADQRVRVAEHLAEVSHQVCDRQDDVIAVLQHLVSPYRQALVQGAAHGDGDVDNRPNPALRADNLRIRAEVRSIAASPCPH